MTSIAWRRRTSINIETALEGVVKRKICKDTIKAVRESGHWFSVRERAREEVRDRQPLQWEEPLPDENNPPYVRLQTPACVKEVQGQPKNLAHHWSALATKLHRSFEGAFHLQRSHPPHSRQGFFAKLDLQKAESTLTHRPQCHQNTRDPCRRKRGLNNTSAMPSAKVQQKDHTFELIDCGVSGKCAVLRKKPLAVMVNDEVQEIFLARVSRQGHCPEVALRWRRQPENKFQIDKKSVSKPS